MALEQQSRSAEQVHPSMTRGAVLKASALRIVKRFILFIGKISRPRLVCDDDTPSKAVGHQPSHALTHVVFLNGNP